MFSAFWRLPWLNVKEATKNTGTVGSGIFLSIFVLNMFLSIHESVDFEWQDFDSVTGINIKLYV